MFDNCHNAIQPELLDLFQMKRVLLIFGFIFYFTQLGYCQWYPTGKPYHTQYTYQNRNDSTQEWENTSKVQFGYDQKNNRNLIQSFEWFNNRWRIQNDQRRRFDGENNLIYESEKYWFSEPYKLATESESKREFDGKLLIRIERFNRDYSSGNTYESSTELKYDENDNFIETLRKSRENNDPYRVSLYNVYYNANECQIAYVSRWGEEGETWNTIDSTRLEVNSNCQTNLEQRFSIDPITNQAQLYSEYQYTREFDENGNVTYLKLEEKFLDSEWTLISEDFYEYDPLYGRIYEEHRFRQDTGFFAYRLINIRNTDSLNFLQTTDIKEPSDSIWKPAGYYGYRVNDLGSIEYSVGENIWYEGDDEYYDRNENQYFFNEENRLIRSIFSNKSINPNEEYYNENEEVFNYRCNGDEIESVSTILESSVVENIGKQDRRTTDYLTQPLCAEADGSSRISLFPNPATEYIHISYPETIGRSRVSIIDQSGKVVIEKEQFVSSYFTIDLATMIAGSYILKIESDKVNDSQRFVVVK